MKIIRSIFILIAAASMTEVFAQGLELQAVIRPALTSLRGNDIIEDFDPAINISAGFGVNYFVTDKSFINAAVLYDRKGNEIEVAFRDEQNQPLGSGKVSNNFDYITIPIQWGLRFGRKIKYQFGIGAYGGFLLRCKEVSHGPFEDVEKDRTDNFKRVDFGLSASFAVLIPLNESWFINLGVNDNLGLVNVSDVPVAKDGTIKHNSLGLTIGANFKIK